MRIISGKFKGRKLQPPAGDIRPTLDRVRETLFDIIQFDVPGSVFLDLFAGSGAVGIEAISRGAKEVYFCENNRISRTVLSKNLEITGSTKVYECDYKVALKSFVSGSLDFIYLDPPFESNFGIDALNTIGKQKLLKNNGVVIFEHPRGELTNDEIEGLSLQREKEIGSVKLSFYRRKL